MDVRRIPNEVVFALVAANNARQNALVTSQFHAAKTSITGGTYQDPTESAVQITAANASDLATSLTLCNQMFGFVNQHFADPGAHNTALSAQLTTPLAVDLATAITRANAIRTAYEAHRTASSVHFNNDATNTITAVASSDQSSLNTLLNELKTDINAHMSSAPTGGIYINLVSP